ncbi:ABC transporter substrate-binding protein [Nonomuraea muscovyensis]|uniref:ABC transporter substrate-binding protein n=1 Tax=Nonomuraea muscovyensis TaxID=1124761 RepID=UPI0033D56E61|nr:putative transporter substrate binding protein [Nonomuraea muscovyensis]
MRSPRPRPIRLPAAAALSATTLCVLVAGCGGGESAGQASSGKATLSMYAWSSSPAEDGVLRKAIDDYNKLGRATVKLNILPEYDTALQTALAGGEPPDVFYLNDNKVPDLAKAGALEPIGDKMDKPGDFYPTLKDSFTYKGTFYCPPKDFSTLQLVYDKDALAGAGVKPPTTWDELAAAAKALTKPDRPGLVLNAEFYRWGVFAVAAGGWLTDDAVTKATADTPEMTKGMELLAGLHKAGYAASPQTVGAGWGGEALGKGKAAMTVEGNWIVGAMKTDFPKVKYGIAELPAGPAGKGTLSFSACYAVAKSSADTDAATDFVRFLTAPERQLEFTKQFPVMPSRQSLAEKWLADKPELKPFVDGSTYARDSIFVPGFKPVIDDINDGIQGLAKGNRQVADVLTATQKVAESTLGG